MTRKEMNIDSPFPSIGRGNRLEVKQYGSNTSPPLSEDFETHGRKGGLATFASRGVEHYRMMGRRSAEKRKALKAAPTISVEALRALRDQLRPFGIPLDSMTPEQNAEIWQELAEGYRRHISKEKDV
jgi:hypothetical protein